MKRGKRDLDRGCQQLDGLWLGYDNFLYKKKVLNLNVFFFFVCFCFCFFWKKIFISK